MWLLGFVVALVVCIEVNLVVNVANPVDLLLLLVNADVVVACVADYW